MSKRFFTKINKNGRNVIIDKECHIEIIDLTLACDVLNRLDLKLKTYNEQLGEQQATISQLEEKNDRIKTKGLKVLAFYESKLKDVVGTEDFQSVRDEIWIVRHILYEMDVIKDE